MKEGQRANEANEANEVNGVQGVNEVKGEMGRGARSCVSDNETTNNVETCHGASLEKEK